MREYTEQHYLPSATAYTARAANQGAIGKKIVDWQRTLEQKWGALHFGELKVETRGGQHQFEVQLYLDDLDPEAVRVELYADGIDGGASAKLDMNRVRRVSGASGAYVYSAAAPASRPATAYTARLVPHHDGVAIPLEDERIRWERS